MLVDAEPGPYRDLADDCPQASVLDLGAPAAPGADHVMMVVGVAADVRVLTAREIDPLDRPKLGQDVERPEDGRASDPETPRARLGHEARRREVAWLIGDQLSDCPARFSEAIAGSLERDQQGRVVDHDSNDIRYRQLTGLGLTE
jgi:hypothetical protein